MEAAGRGASSREESGPWARRMQCRTCERKQMHSGGGATQTVDEARTRHNKIGVNTPDNILRRGVAGAMASGPLAIGLVRGRVSRVQLYSWARGLAQGWYAAKLSRSARRKVCRFGSSPVPRLEDARPAPPLPSGLWLGWAEEFGSALATFCSSVRLTILVAGPQVSAPQPCVPPSSLVLPLPPRIVS